jgi:hypothetical protein
MSSPKFVWLIRTWCSVDTFWEHVREHKEYDIAYIRPDVVLEEIDRIVLKEQSDWAAMCEGTGLKEGDREFEVDKPSLDQLKSRSFFKFCTVTSTPQASEDFMQSWYVERIRVVEG